MKGRHLLVLPPMRCDDDCGECCGLAPATEVEFQRIARFVAERGIVPKAQGATCPLYQNGRCAVYEVRPFACELFGHVLRMPCPRGYNRNVADRDARREVKRRGPATRVLHELLPEFRNLGSVALREAETS